MHLAVRRQGPCGGWVAAVTKPSRCQHPQCATSECSPFFCGCKQEGEGVTTPCRIGLEPTAAPVATFGWPRSPRMPPFCPSPRQSGTAAAAATSSMRPAVTSPGKRGGEHSAHARVVVFYCSAPQTPLAVIFKQRLTIATVKTNRRPVLNRGQTHKLPPRVTTCARGPCPLHRPSSPSRDAHDCLWLSHRHALIRPLSHP